MGTVQGTLAFLSQSDRMLGTHSITLPFSHTAQVRSHIQVLFREHRYLTSPRLTKTQLEKGQRVRAIHPRTKTRQLILL